MLEKFKNLDKKMLIYLGIGFGCILLLIIILVVLKLSVKKGVDSKTFESRLKSAAISYFKDNDSELPKNGDRKTISIDELVDKKYLKDNLKKGLKCSGYVSVNNNNGFYKYQPIIECSDNYSTNLLYKKILNDSPAGTSRDGLYKVNDYYLFRGENPNNNVVFANMNWKILRINSDNTIRMIAVKKIDKDVWDDRYNLDSQDYTGKNIFEISRIKETLKRYFNDSQIFSNEDKALIVPTELCIGKRNENSNVFDGSIECSVKSEKLPLGLLQANEFQIISLDPDCKKMDDSQCGNYNFLSTFNSLWTITADSSTSYKAYMFSGLMNLRNTDREANINIVVNISENALYSSGDGSETNPYTIK